jgi:hypothetical protein
LSEVRSRLNQSRVCGVIVLGLAWLLVAPRVSARAGCVELVGELPHALSGCATEQRVCESYQRAYAADGGEVSGAFVPLQVRLGTPSAQAGDATVLELDAFTAERWLGHRTLSLRARDCAALPDALALVLVLLAHESPPAQPLPQVSAPLPPPAAATPAHEARARSAPVGDFSLGAGAGLMIGALPSAALALQLQAATLGVPLSLRARATLLWPQEQRIAEGYVQTNDYELALEACAGFSFRDAPRVTLRLCAGPRVGLMRVRARDFALRNDRTTEFLLYLGLMPELALALGPNTSLQLGIAAALALLRPRFGVGLDSGLRVSALSTPSWLRTELLLSLVQIF